MATNVNTMPSTEEQTVDLTSDDVICYEGIQAKLKHKSLTFCRQCCILFIHKMHTTY